MAPSLLVFLAISTPAAAGEGLWRPEQVAAQHDALVREGLAMAPAQVARLDGPVLGAIVETAHCSGAFVSPDGLLATGYHCITEALQAASLPGEDLFENGFHARTGGEERWAGAGERVRLTIATRDVKREVLDGAKRLEGTRYHEQIELNINKLVAKCEAEGRFHCEVAVFDHGAEYQLVTQQEFRDVRLVYAPPRAVGFFGGDADNWEWPRHSGDFAFVRVYAGPDGKPADFAKANKPLKPRAHLEIEPKGVNPGDFVMVAGYPAWSNRWCSAAQLEATRDTVFPRQLEVLRDLQTVLREFGGKEPHLAARLAPRLLAVDNDVKYVQGALAALHRTNVADDQRALERELASWIRSDPDRTMVWGDTLEQLRLLHADIASTAHRDAVMDALAGDSTPMAAALTIYTFAEEAKKRDDRRRAGFQERDRAALLDGMLQAESGYEAVVDRAVLGVRLRRALTLPPDARPPELWAWLEARTDRGTLDAILEVELDRLYADHSLLDAKTRKKLLDRKPWDLSRSGSPWFELAAALHGYGQRVRVEREAREARLRALFPLHLEAVRAFVAHRPEIAIPTYPDANGTVRLGFGRVEGYAPSDGLIAAPWTTVRGFIQKRGAPPYDTPESLVQAIYRKEWGPYAPAELGTVPVDFLTTLDTTRGSSGSLTLNAQGKWVGIVFDGNHEAMGSDFVFDDGVARSIHTHVRFVLWYLDAVAGADELLEELGAKPALASPRR